MEMNALSIFEEIRFVVELLSAELVFLVPFVPAKNKVIFKTILAFVGYSIAALGYFFVVDFISGPTIRQIAVCSWYIFLALSTILFCRSLFNIGIVDSLYVVIVAYAAQHIIYITIHEALALYYMPLLTKHISTYILLSILGCSLLYLGLYLCFSRKLKEANGALFKDSPVFILYYVIFIGIMMIASFSAQHLFRIGDGVRDFGIIWGVTNCILVLGIQYITFKSTVASREQNIISRMLMDSARHYEISKELIDLVNRNAHDMKHKLKALRNLSDEQKENFINEQMSHIEEYQNLVFCDNEVLNTILAEKSLYCSSQNITFSCSIKQANLDFIDVIDLYAILGNGIDNAIECVSQYKDESKRVISLNVSSKNAFTIIQIENYSQTYSNEATKLPRTTKTEPGHGFGLKSIKYIAKKYGGDMYFANADGIFSLQVMFPLPVVPK